MLYEAPGDDRKEGEHTDFGDLLQHDGHRPPQSSSAEEADGPGWRGILHCSGLVETIIGTLGKFKLQTYKAMRTVLLDERAKIDLTSKVLQRVDMTTMAVIHFTFMPSALGISLAERLTPEQT